MKKRGLSTAMSELSLEIKRLRNDPLPSNEYYCDNVRCWGIVDIDSFENMTQADFITKMTARLGITWLILPKLSKDQEPIFLTKFNVVMLKILVAKRVTQIVMITNRYILRWDSVIKQEITIVNNVLMLKVQKDVEIEVTQGVCKDGFMLCDKCSSR